MDPVPPTLIQPSPRKPRGRLVPVQGCSPSHPGGLPGTPGVPTGAASAPGPPTPLPCRGQHGRAPSPTGLLTMLVSCYRRGFRAPSCAQLLWKGRKGTKGGDARSARWAGPCPGTALPSPGNPAPAVPQAGPAGESARLSPTHTRGRTGLSPAPPHGAAHGTLHSRPIPVLAAPSPRLLTGPCLCAPSPFTGPHPGHPSRQRARLTPRPAAWPVPARRGSPEPALPARPGHRNAEPQRRRSPPPESTTRWRRPGGRGPALAVIATAPSKARPFALRASPHLRPAPQGPSLDADRSNSWSLKRRAAPPSPERRRQRTLGTRDARQSPAPSLAAPSHWLPSEKGGRSANGRGPRLRAPDRAPRSEPPLGRSAPRGPRYKLIPGRPAVPH